MTAPDASGSDELRRRVLDALQRVLDPELGLNVVDLGLVYRVEIDGGRVRVALTMTTAACPLSEQIVEDAQRQLRALDGVESAQVELVWEPAWSPDRMSEAAKQTLGWNR